MRELVELELKSVFGSGGGDGGEHAGDHRGPEGFGSDSGGSSFDHIVRESERQTNNPGGAGLFGKMVDSLAGLWGGPFSSGGKETGPGGPKGGRSVL